MNKILMKLIGRPQTLGEGLRKVKRAFLVDAESVGEVSNGVRRYVAKDGKAVTMKLSDASFSSLGEDFNVFIVRKHIPDRFVDRYTNGKTYAGVGRASKGKTFLFKTTEYNNGAREKVTQDYIKNESGQIGLLLNQLEEALS